LRKTLTVSSPLPFGVQCVPDPHSKVVTRKRAHLVSIAFRRSVRSRPLGEVEFTILNALSPLPFGVQCVPDYMTAYPTCTRETGVSIAFRRSVRSRRNRDMERGVMKLRLHCLSAFSAFPTAHRGIRVDSPHSRLHCLSAFSAFPTPRRDGIRLSHILESPLPFGVQCVPDDFRSWFLRVRQAGLHCLSAFSAFPTRRGSKNSK